MKLTRRPRFDGSDLPAYTHPNGWAIKKEKRDWSARGFPTGLNMGDKHPLYSYAVYSVPAKQYPFVSFPTLREAREWCDTHKRVYEPGGYVLREVPRETSARPPLPRPRDRARAPPRARAFPGFKAARIVDEVRIAFREGRFSGRAPAGFAGFKPEHYGFFAWTPDGQRIYAMRTDDNVVAVTTVVRAYEKCDPARNEHGMLDCPHGCVTACARSGL